MGVRRRVTPWQHRRRLFSTLFLCVTIALVGTPTVQAAADTAGPIVQPAPRRVLLLGDSITQGSSGDLTWRWFLSRSLEGTGISLVGPFTTVVRDKQEPGRPGRYADPDFQVAHAATWGDSFSRPLSDHMGHLRRFRPDTVVLMLGTNDVKRYGLSAERTLELTADWITRAREADPGVDIVVAQAPVTSVPALSDYNRLLDLLVDEMSTPEERLVVARTAAGYRMGAPLTEGQVTTPGNTWDAWHPNVRGQQLIGAAVADALNDMGAGTATVRPLTVVQESAAPFGRIRVKARRHDFVVTWKRPLGSTSVDLRTRSGARAWTPVASSVVRERYVVKGVNPCRRLSVQLRPRKGWTLSGPAYSSPVVRVAPSTRCVAPKKRKGAPATPRSNR